MTGELSALNQQGIKFDSITADSRQVKAGSVFLAYPGETADGRSYIAQAIAQGAAAVLWERSGFDWKPEWQLPNFPVHGLRARAGYIADDFYEQPSRQLWMVGVTGTNGKTSCSQWLAQALTAIGRKTAVIGTLGNGYPGALSHAINTTPDPIMLHGLLADYHRQGAAAVAMEVSSHGLDQGRVNGVHFDVALFTNLTRDHLDYHGDMQSYAAAKRKLFDWPGLGSAVLNTDDAFGREVAVALRQQGRQVLTYGLDDGDVRGVALQFDEQGLTMHVDTPYGSAEVKAALLGRFNAYNLLAVLATLLVSNVSLAQAANAIANLRPVSGRMQQLGGGNKPLVVIDYAHTPDALEKVLVALREQGKGRLFCVFGCGGNRDAGKRPIMGALASQLADSVIVTSDNPRHENPNDIIAEIVAGVKGSCHVEPDRAAAIELAVNMAQTGDIVLVAGKGHEDYQEIAGVRHHFSDQEVVALALKQYGGVA